MNFKLSLRERLMTAVVLAIFAVALCILFSGTSNAHANPSFFVRANKTSTATAGPTTLATTSVSILGPGVGTTTIVLNTNIGTLLTVDNLALKLYRNASSTLTSTVIEFEYSSNCDATSPDWYPAATTSPVVAASVPVGSFTSEQASAKFTWNFASSTVGAIGAVASNDELILPIPVYERCVRAVITTPPAAAGSMLYAEFVGKRENN